MIYDFTDTRADEYVYSVRMKVCDLNLRYFVITFGCQQNEADSERIRGLCQLMGYSEATEASDADLVIVNTCAIREHAEMKALSLLGRFKSKAKENANFVLGVVGCIAAEPHVRDMIRESFHYVSFTVEPNMLHRIPEVVFSALEHRRRSFILGEDKGNLCEGISPERVSDHKAWVPVMYGCNNFCSYCIVPYVRGRERSRLSSHIIKECRDLVASGYKEITLLGQNVNSYRSDLDFPDLLERIAEIDGDFRIKFMTSHPKDASDKLISVMAKYTPKIMPYFHLPLQSGSNRILSLMNRTYNTEHFVGIVDRLRRQIPDICLSTDVIVGFPSEGEDDFSATLDVIGEVKFDSVYAFKYSRRAGTVAADMEGRVEKEISEDRLSRLLAFQDPISKEHNIKHLGRVERVLVDSTSRRGDLLTVSARNDSNKLIHFAAGKDAVGKFRNVIITEAGPYDLFAEEIK